MTLVIVSVNFSFHSLFTYETCGNPTSNATVTDPDQIVLCALVAWHEVVYFWIDADFLPPWGKRTERETLHFVFHNLLIWLLLTPACSELTCFAQWVFVLQPAHEPHTLIPLKAQVIGINKNYLYMQNYTGALECFRIDRMPGGLLSEISPITARLKYG